MYIDGFVLAVPTANRAAYQAYAQAAAPLFKAHGALSVVESWGVDVPEGKLTSFPLAVQLQADETVVFSWITWPSKAVRDVAWEKLMQEPLFDIKTNPMPCDGKRMIFGGFESLLVL